MANFFLEKRPIQGTNLSVPYATVGVMMFGKRTPEPEARRIVDRALDLGLRFFDTANAYQGGASEETLGRILKGRRESCVIATKVGNRREAGKREGLSRQTILDAIDASLARLGTDYVDIYYLHAPDYNAPIEETLEALDRIVRAGKVRHPALSNFGAWQSLEILHLCEKEDWPRPVASQMIYNPLVRQIEHEHVRFCRRYGMFLTVFNPLAAGLLTGKYANLEDQTRGSRFVDNPNYQGRFWSERMFQGMLGLRRIAEEEGMPLTHLTLAWIRQTGNADNILLGPSTYEQFEDCLAAGEKTISAEGMKKIADFLQEFEGTDANYAR
ncbi:aldo/keto reductase [Candidatus Sumerlaeota bacterium]|nr:aldo/keto reductase [Candidatus Sumerlaeota bacterium]